MSDINGGLDLSWKATESVTEVVMELKSYFATDDPNNESQVFELTKKSRDTSVESSQTSVIDKMNNQNLRNAQQKKKNHDDKIKKKNEYYKQ